MHFSDFYVTQIRRASVRPKGIRKVVNGAAALIATGACLNLIAPAASAATLTRRVVVAGTPSEVWAVIGPFCAIKNWLPPVGSCKESGESPLVRTLVTKDGQATFVERQTSRSDTDHFYSYVFVSSPLPVSRYKSTIAVTPQGSSQSVVTWHASYTPDAGRDADAKAALSGIYDAGLTSIQTQAAQRVVPATAK
jgi:Polyketide cyclase / dehydrase and lipid transport